MGYLDEGYCIKVSTATAGSPEVWLICFKSLKEQEVWTQKLKDNSDMNLKTPYKDTFNAKAYIKGGFGDLNKLQFR